MTLQELLAEYSELPEYVGGEQLTVSSQGGYGNAPLHIALWRNISEEIDLLLNMGADPNMRGEYGDRPLHIALRQNNMMAVERLLRAGADPGCVNDDGQDSWREAELSGLKTALQILVVNTTTKK